MKHVKKLPLIFAILIATILIVILIRQIGYSSEGKINSATSPNYPTILPTNKSIADLGGWQRISPTESEPVFAYSDSIESIPITVNQQPIPSGLKNNTEKEVEELAKSSNYSNRLNTKTTKAYIGISAKGPQYTLFVKNDLLVVIRAQSKVSDEAWIRYIDSLDTPVTTNVSY